MTATPDRLIVELQQLKPAARADVLSKLDPDSRAVVLQAMRAAPKPTPLEKRIRSRTSLEELQAPRRAAEAAYELGGCKGVIRLMTIRWNLDLYGSSDEAAELLFLRTSAINQAKKELREDSPAEQEERSQLAYERLVERARAEQERRHLERCAKASAHQTPSAPLRRINGECRVIRPSFASPTPLTASTPTQPEESTPMDEGINAALDDLIADVQSEPSIENPAPATPEPADPTIAADREPKRRRGLKCPPRIEKALDALIHEIRFFEDETHPEPLVDPPADVSDINAGAGGDEVLSVVIGGDTAEPSTQNELQISQPAAAGRGNATQVELGGESAWDVVAGQSASASDLRDFIEASDHEPALRAAATLQALSRLREALSQVDEMAAVDSTLEIHLQDAVLLCRQLLSRLR